MFRVWARASELYLSVRCLHLNFTAVTVSRELEVMTSQRRIGNLLPPTIYILHFLGKTLGPISRLRIVYNKAILR